MRITLVRHGEVEEPRLGLEATGHDDPTLTELGRRQAQALAAVLRDAVHRGESVEALYSSPLRAASATAGVIAATLGIAAAQIAPELSTLTPEVVPDDGGLDTLTAMQERAWGLIEALKQRHDARSTIVLVTHDLTIRTLVCRALSMPLDGLRRFALDPASLSTIEYRAQPRERTLIANLNEVCHLE